MNGFEILPFNNNEINRLIVLSSLNFNGFDLDIETKAVRSTGLDSKAASNCHLALNFTPALLIVSLLLFVFSIWPDSV